MSGRARILGKLPLWSYFPIGLVLLYAGPWAIAAIVGADDGVDPKAAMLRDAPPWMLLLVPMVVEIGEALLWTVAFTEGFAYAFRAPVLGVLCGWLAYVAYHVPHGMLAVVVSGWVGAVWGCLYVVMRERSRWAAFVNLVGLRWAFFAYVYAVSGGLRGFGA